MEHADVSADVHFSLARLIPRGRLRRCLAPPNEGRQREAIGLYERMGFRPRGPFGPRNIETSSFLRRCFPQTDKFRCNSAVRLFNSPDRPQKIRCSAA